MTPKEQKLQWVRQISGGGGGRTSGGSPNSEDGSAKVSVDLASYTSSAKADAAPASNHTLIAKPVKPKGFSPESVITLVDTLIYLGTRSFLEGTYKPESPTRTGESAIDDALSQAATVVGIWNDPSNLSLAQTYWGKAGPRLKTLLNQAAPQSLDQARLKSAREAVDNIGKQLGIRVAKEKAAKNAKPLPTESLQVLVDNLVYLSDKSFLLGGYKPKPLNTSGERSIDEALAQAASTITLWNDPKTIQNARAYWRDAETRLNALLTQAAKHGFDAAKIATARQSIENITKYLGIRLAQFKVADAEAEIETPDVSEALDIRKMKEMEKGLDPFRTNVQQIKRLAKEDSKLAKAAEAIELYYSVTEAKDKLAAFRKSEWKDRVKTIGELTLFMTGIAKDTVEAHARIAIKAAEKAGNKALAQQLTEKFKGLKTVTRLLALYEIYKSVSELITAIEKGDERAIAAAGFNVAAAVISGAEAVGVVSATGAAAATGVAFIIWVEVDVVLSVAQLHKWAKEMRALKAVRNAITDTKKIVPMGRKMAAAAKMVLEAQAAQDGAGVAEIESYEKQANKLAASVAQNLKVLASNHFNRDDKDSVGGYASLMRPLGDPARQALSHAFMGIIPADPFSVTQAFETIVRGIKSMVDAGNKLYGHADPAGVYSE
jgi:hypothetical protein